MPVEQVVPTGPLHTVPVEWLGHGWGFHQRVAVCRVVVPVPLYRHCCVLWRYPGTTPDIFLGHMRYLAGEGYYFVYPWFTRVYPLAGHILATSRRIRYNIYVHTKYALFVSKTYFGERTKNLDSH